MNLKPESWWNYKQVGNYLGHSSSFAYLLKSRKLVRAHRNENGLWLFSKADVMALKPQKPPARRLPPISMDVLRAAMETLCDKPSRPQRTIATLKTPSLHIPCKPQSAKAPMMKG